MKKTKTLVASLIALVLCFTMVIGTTFAWFTDSVTNTNNIITSGNVNVELWHTANSDTTYTEVNDSTKLFINTSGGDIIWEPGVTSVENFQIKNVGSLALKYQFSIKAIAKTATEDGKTLADILTLKVAGEEVNYSAFFGNGYTLNGEILAGEDAHNYAVSIAWDREALKNVEGYQANDYNVTNGLKIYLGIELVATQLNHESDGMGNNFDDEAEYPNISNAIDVSGTTNQDVNVSTNGEEAVKVVLSANLVNNLPENVESISLFHTEPIFNEETQTVTFELIEIVDQNGDIIDLENLQLDEQIKVTLPAQPQLANKPVTIMHNGEKVASVTADDNGVITYLANHFCKVEVTEAEWAELADESWYSNQTTAFEISDVKQLAGLAQLVNGGETFKGKTVTLIADIDLQNCKWTPIGNSTNKFQGTFDGQNHTIKNLNCVMEGKSNVGLFGMTTDGEVKNLTVENAIITGRLNVGVVAGTPYTSKYTNVSVVGHVEVNGMSYVGGVGGKNAYANWTNITVNVDETSYVKANSVENGTAYRTYVGGVVGFMGEGGHTFENITSNINVSGSTCDVGGIVGIAHYGNSFINCSSSGNVSIFNGIEAADVEEMGGIAGVWHNGGANVTFTNCSFTGKLEANLTEGVDLSNNTITGKPYSESGKGKLIINDAVVVYTADELVEALKIGENVVLANNITINQDEHMGGSGYGKAGITIDGQTLYGDGHKLTVYGANATWDCAIYIKSGSIKDIVVAGAMRGIFTGGTNGNIYMENVSFDDVVYTFNSDGGNKEFGVYAKDCAFNGWTSFSDVHKEVIFTNCCFSEGSGYAFCRPYNSTTFTGCTFEAGFEMDTRAAVTLENCTIGGVELTAENLNVLVTSNIANATIK